MDSRCHASRSLSFNSGQLTPRIHTGAYLTVTVAVALPPSLLLTVILCGLVGQENLPEYFLPFLVNVPMSVSVEVTKTWSVAVELVLVA